MPNLENANNESNRNKNNKDNSTRFFENSFINKTYHHVRSFGKDLSNLQKYQEAHHAYGDTTTNNSKPQQPQPKIVRVKSQIGTSAASQQSSQHRFLNAKASIGGGAGDYLGQTESHQNYGQQVPNKIMISKEH